MHTERDTTESTPGRPIRGLRSLALLAAAGLLSWYAVADDPPGPFAEPEAPVERPVPAAPVEPRDEYPTLATLAPDGSFAGEFRYVGSASCASSNCHGGNGEGRNRPVRSADGHRRRGDINRHGNETWGGEYTIWVQRDPHARAYEVLFDEKSKRMAEALGIEKAHTDARCLNCHAVNVERHHSTPVHASKPAIQDGVACEACHGPAGDWLDLHKQSDWPTLSPEEKAKHGFWNLDDVLTRGRLCVSCHVGGEGRDVDHDLIAAGHPRLNFELSAYQALLPHHWNEDANIAQEHVTVRDAAEFEARSWAVGQAVLAEATVGQTLRRAADPHAVWPEFTETGCFACHHDLFVEIPLAPDMTEGAHQSWRQQRGFSTPRAGGYPWGTWAIPLLPTLDPDGKAFSMDDLNRLREVMSRPRPDREKVAEAAALHAALSEWAVKLNEAEYGPEVRAAYRRDLARNAPNLAHEDWDSATQAWLAIAALERGESIVGEKNEPLRVVLRRIRGNLEFPLGERRFSSPRDFNTKIEQLRRDFASLRELAQ